MRRWESRTKSVVDWWFFRHRLTSGGQAVRNMLSNASPLHDTDMLYIVGAFIWTLSCHAGIFSEQHCQGEQKDYSYEMREDEWMVFVERPNLKHAHDNRTDATSPRTVFLFHSALFFPHISQHYFSSLFWSQNRYDHSSATIKYELGNTDSDGLREPVNMSYKH